MKFLKSTILYSLFVGSLFIAFSFFLFPQKADACELNLTDGSLRFRTATTNGGIQPEGWFTEENPPFVYVDFKTINCENSDPLYLTIFGVGEDSSGFIYIQTTPPLENYPINLGQLDENGGMSLAFHPDEEPCFGDNSDTSESDCLIFAMFTDQPTTSPNANIKGLIGDLIGSVSLDQGGLFANQFGTSSMAPTSGCSNYAGYFYQITQNCAFASVGWSGLFSSTTADQKLINYYNTYGSSYQSVSSSEGQQVAKIAIPGLLYKCETIISEADFGCAFSDGWTQIPNNILPYGETMPDDEGIVTVNPLADLYQQEYVPLAPLPFEGLNGGSTPNLGEYLASMFKMGIVVVIILAVIMIVFHGIALSTVGAIQGKQDHKKGVWNAILGLVLALGSWLLLNTVNPELASNLGVGIPNVSIDGYVYTAPGVASLPTDGSCGPQQPPACPTCQPIEGGIQLKPEVAQSGHNTISQLMLQKLYNMQNTLSTNNMSWRVTEAFSPTYLGHCSQCHYKGTCIDANFVGSSSPTPQNIEAFVQAASAAGLRAVYETNSQNTINQIQEQTDLQPSTKGGSGNYLLLNGITAPHFSVYNQ